MSREESESRGGDVDVSLRTDTPTLPGRQSENFGTDLSLGWLPLSPLATDETSASAGAFGSWEVSDAPYSPSNSWSIPELLPSGTFCSDNDNTPALGQNSLLLSGDIVPALILENTSLDDDVPHFVLNDEGLDLGSNRRADSSLLSAAQPLTTDGEARGRIYSTHARDHDLQTGEISPAEDYSLIPIRSLTLPINGGSSRRHELWDFPESRMQRLLESPNRCRLPRSRSSFRDLPASDAAFLTNPELLRHNILQSWRCLKASRKNAAGAAGRKLAGSDDKDEENIDDASYFECNICFELAEGPVVTPCGHLFCWPCLYHWLHDPFSHSECPVCKGQVLEENVTPIYGRGGTENIKQEDGESGVKIPPRPHANRIASARQELQTPAWQILEGRVGFRHVILDEEVPNSVRTLPRRSLTPRRRSNATQSTTGVRLRAQRTQIDMGSGSNPAAVDILNEIALDHQLAQEHNLTSPDSRMVAAGANHDALPPRSTTVPLAQSLHNTRHRMESSLGADHSSDSSTMAVVHGDLVYHPELQGSLTDASTRPGRRSSSRRRGRNAIADSVDADGRLHQSRQRRV